MKSAVSVPGNLYEHAEERTGRLGISRSELYARALRDLVDRLERSAVTKRLDAAFTATDSSLPPVLVVQSDSFDRSRIATVVVATITSDLTLTQVAGVVRLPKRSCGLDRDSVINLSQLATVERFRFERRAGVASPNVMLAVDEALTLVLSP